MVLFNASLLTPPRLNSQDPKFIVIASGAIVAVLTALYIAVSLFRPAANDPKNYRVVHRQLSGVGDPLSPPLLDVTGEITTIAKDAITVRSGTNDGSNRSISRRALISATTRITALHFIPVIKGMQKQFEPKDIPIAFDQLKEGIRVEVFSTEDIRDRDDFSATHIRFLP